MNQGDLLIWSGNTARDTLLTEVLAFPFERVLDNSETPLCTLMNTYGSDKGAGWHNYTKLYHYLLGRQRVAVRQVFEVGLGTNYLDARSNMGATGKPGASLRAWRDYFSNAQISGADIDRRILFEEDRITTRYCDQANAREIEALWAATPDSQYDLMIDDGLHEFEANKTFLENSLHKLSATGLYVIEDIVVSERNLADFQDLLRGMPVQSVIVKMPSSTNGTDNCLTLIRKQVA